MLVSVGCYSPSYGDCQISCASGAGCPSGLRCDGTGMCRPANTVGNCPGGTGDGGMQADASPDASFACWSGVQPPANFDPCNGFPGTSAFSFVAGAVFDTDVHTYNGTPAPGGIYHDPTTNGSVWLLHVTSFDIPSPQHFNVRGSLPLLIVSDTSITIEGVINATAGVKLAPIGCADLSGTSSTTGSGGGGGGGGGNGGKGGGGGPSSIGTLGGLGDSFHNNPSLSPLAPGCPGGAGGSDTNAGTMSGGGIGGNGGVAIELAAQNTIMLSSGALILAGGGPGSNGIASTSVGTASGGGGGGAGGAILLEAPMIMIPGGTSVCAGGGGGGQGGSTGGSGGIALSGSCVVATGGNGATSGGPGGDGSIDQSIAGGVGQVGMTGANNGGGGGGGGAGRIRLHGMVTLGGQIVPQPTTSP